MAERSRQKESRHLSKLITWLYFSFCLSAIVDASAFTVTAVWGPIIPPLEKTNGEKEPCSTSRIRGSYILLFSFSALSSTFTTGWCRYDSAFKYNTFVSKNAFCCFIQKPRARMSTRASSVVFVVLRRNDSPVNGSNSGSFSTS
eukprot:Lithocolla_globosa_v1_NODE_3585_length_1630_cov_24.224127.p3 type:complete len:144 gc:universal NODE_3585_length_1630_cov_24.224127:156-587(+)